MDGFTTGSVATLTAGIEEGELLRELGEEQGVIQLSFVTAKFHLVIRPQIQQTVENKCVNKPNSLYINFYYYLCIKLQHQGVE